MRVLYVYADTPVEWNCSEWRCAVPARAINRLPGHSAELLSLADFARDEPQARELCDAADVIVVQRTLVGPVLQAIERWKARGKTLIADFDDAYHLMPPTNPSFAFWREGRALRFDGGPAERIDPPPLQQFRAGLRLVHAATVPARLLAQDYSHLTSVHLVPNYLDLEKYLGVPRQAHEGIVIGWGGSLSHLRSFTESGVLLALKRVCRDRPQVRVVINGGDRRIFDELPLPRAQKELRPWVPYSRWPRQLAEYDIGLAPLFGAYDLRRSWIKPLEYMVMKIPWVATRAAPYEGLAPYGKLVENRPRDWEQALLQIIDDLPTQRAAAAGEPYRFALAQSVDRNADSILATYESIAQSARLAEPSLVLHP